MSTDPNVIAQTPDEPLQDALELIQLAGFSADIEHTRQLYVNRDLRMSQIEWIGFDMDYTLALYHQVELDALSVRYTLEQLIEHFGYPTSIRTIKPDPEFAIRGLVIDRARGNILKMDSHHYVGRAYHGLAPLPADQRRTYNDAPVRLSTDRYVLVDTLFSLPETFLYAALIDHLERRSDALPLDYARLYDDVRGAIDQAHADGRMKSEILGDIQRYVKRDDELSLTLHKFRSAGKSLFLLTNSECYYTNALMSYLLDGQTDSYPSWRTYFDVVITSAQKPLFFRGTAPFLRVDEEGGGRTPSDSFQSGQIYEGGNFSDFEKMLGIRGSEVLYVGDHIYGDIVRSKRDSAWRTAMVIQEMERELRKRDTMKAELSRWAELDRRLASLNSDLAACRRVLQRLEAVHGDRLAAAGAGDKAYRARRGLKQSIEQLNRSRRDVLSRLIELDEEISINFNPYWGLLFKEGAEHSVFGGQVEAYACVYTSRVSNFRLYSPMRYFRAPQQHMPHEF